MQKINAEIVRKLAKYAESRARGMSWEYVGRTDDRKVSMIKRWTRVYSAVWQRLLAAACRQVEAEGVAESITVLRGLLRAEDEKTRSIVGRALLALREKRKPDDTPVAVESLTDLSRANDFLATKTQEVVDEVIAEAERKKRKSTQ